jgi:hypothetical protein
MKLKLSRVIFIIYLLFTLAENASAQQKWLWAKSLCGTGSHGIYSTVLDESGNLYTAGFFSKTIDFNPDAGTFNLTSKQFTNDIFISKYDADGNFIWAKSFGGTGNDGANNLQIDSQGNLYLIGHFDDLADLNPDKFKSLNLKSKGEYDVFVMKLNNSGNLIWVKTFGGLGYDNGNSLALDNYGNLYVTGTFDGTADFDPDTIKEYNLASKGKSDMYISKFDTIGNFIWAKAIGGKGYDHGALTIGPSGSIYIYGAFEDTADFDPDLTNTFILTSNGKNDMFISKLNKNGDFVWAKSAGGSDYDVCGITFDRSGNIYVSGQFGKTVDFNMDIGAINNLTAIGGQEAFIAKYDSSANFIWIRQIGGTGYEANGVIVKPDGNIYVIGWFEKNVIFNYGLPRTIEFTSSGGINIFISKYDSSGTLWWAKKIGGDKDDLNISLKINNIGEGIMTGTFESSTISFDGITLKNKNYPYFGCSFIAKLNNMKGISSADPHGISLYPQPADNYCNINFENQQSRVKVIISDLTGRIIYVDSKDQSQKIILNTENFRPGIYSMQIITENFLEAKKLIIKK